MWLLYQQFSGQCSRYHVVSLAGAKLQKIMEKLLNKMGAGAYRTTTLAISILMKGVKRHNHKVNVEHGNDKVMKLEMQFFRF